MLPYTETRYSLQARNRIKTCELFYFIYGKLSFVDEVFEMLRQRVGTGNWLPVVERVVENLTKLTGVGEENAHGETPLNDGQTPVRGTSAARVQRIRSGCRQEIERRPDRYRPPR